MEKVKVTDGVYWVDIPEANLYILCGCPADSIKHLMRRGLVISKELNGVTYENGPNAILLSDISIQNGYFANLAEFPILQMFYRQGMLIPGHPNNTGIKPLLIGIENQVKAQARYVYRGTYGLTTLDELLSSGITEEMANEILKFKYKFTFGQIRETDELLDYRIVDKEPVELRNGAYISREDLNVYKFSYKGQDIVVDLNLKPEEEYEPPVHLDFHSIRREYFSIIHIGEGNGWDVWNPCMSSILIFQGKIYLIDTGPNIKQSLTALGISINEIAGVFHTHAHDDHFAGLTTLVRSDHLIRYYATPLVRVSVMKKLSALMDIPEKRFHHYFKTVDLEFNKWNNIDGLHVLPALSPHPVETNIFYFRTLWEDGYKSYAHLADIISLEKLKEMVTNDPEKPGVTQDFYNRTRELYLKPVNCKKIDIGGGLIHGAAVDFISDSSRKMLLAHTERVLTDAEKEIGSNATFGSQDVLISTCKDYSLQAAHRFLTSYFPEAPRYDLQMLLNCEALDLNVGFNIIKKGEVNKYMYLLLNGVVELIDVNRKIHNILSAGSFIGEYSGITETPSQLTYRSKSYVRVLKIPCQLYIRFINKNYSYIDIIRFHKNIWFLQSTWLFGELISSKILNKIASLIESREYNTGDEIELKDTQLYLLKRGEVHLYFEQIFLEKIKPSEFFGEENIILKSMQFYTARVIEKSKIYIIPGIALEKIPIVEWKLLEMYEKRIKSIGMHM